MNNILQRAKEYVHSSQFNAMRLSVASSAKILSWSYGEVKKIETINYRTLKPERDGLFCARIFGPVKDWECNCGKYKRMKHRGITCEKCGVEVIQARVRRERMGHIQLVAPVCHIWYLKGIPSYLSLVLDVPVRELERVVYFDAYMVINQGKSPYPRKVIITSNEYERYKELHPLDNEFKADSGAQAVRDILLLMDLSLEITALEEEYQRINSVAVRHKIMRRIKVLTNLLQGNINPASMILEVLPVISPDLRPLVPLEGGRFASSDLNDLYRRVINRNIRLQRLYEIDAPSVIVRNEMRMLQEAVDALIDNGRRGPPTRGPNKRALKSLSEMLRGKQGRFRQNLLGKRVDYSGRSVIVVDPELKIDYCGLPKIMALELFKPYVLAGLIEREIAPNLRIAKKMIEDGSSVIWDVLEEVVKDRTVLLNRAPTLHRLGIQAFYPILVNGKAIKIHPLVCFAFNADFDGDQMAVHVPLSKNSQEESKRLILSSNNILSAANGRSVMVPSQDMVLGLHYLSKIRCNVKGESTLFSDSKEVITAFQHDAVGLHASIKLRMPNGTIVETTTGRVILYDSLPKGSDFEWINKVLKKSDLATIVENVHYTFGVKATTEFLDKLKKLGYHYSTMSGVSFSMSDLVTPFKKDEIIKKAEDDVQAVEDLYMNGIITNGERHNKVISLWSHAAADVANEMSKTFEDQNQEAFNNKNNTMQPFNSVFMMLDSGAKGSKDQIKQLVGMRGLMAKPSGEVMETPIKTNFTQGLDVFEYFISTHGARKGQSDTALKTANSGYLTRRLVDVAQDVVITSKDCKTLGYIELQSLKESGDELYTLENRVFGRMIAADVKDPISGELLFDAGHIFDRYDTEKLANSAVSIIAVRSPLTCQIKRGLCAYCYGLDLSKGKLVDIGTTVGIIAAQSIGEPGTQLTMRTFHIGGTASSMGDRPYFTAKHDGTVKLQAIRTIITPQDKTIVTSRKGKVIIISKDGREIQSHDIEYASTLLVHDAQKIQKGTKLAEWDANNKVIVTEKAGLVQYIDLIPNVTMEERFDDSTNRSSKIVLEHKEERHQPAISIIDEAGEEIAHYYLPSGAYLAVENNQKVSIGDVLVKIMREISKTKDITGGLPRIAELFEARAPKEPAIIADIDGEIVFGGLHRGLRKVSVVSGSDTYDYFIPRGKQVTVVHGDRVTAGDPLTSGMPVLHDILRILGISTLQRYLVDQIQAIYLLQGITIKDCHIELIVRQMLRKVRIVDSGNTKFLVGDRIDRIHLQKVNEALTHEGKQGAIARPTLMGITLASLVTESFISAASFQETTKILAEAAMAGQSDPLFGLKENIIIGKLIPAGTGISSFKKQYLDDPTSQENSSAAASSAA